MKVSVIIPVYNVKPYLERCVQSVLNQTYKDIEMILVDDGSIDGSGLLCDELAAKHGQIRVIHQENQGLSAARNTGILHATGEYVFFLDSDDEWLLTDGLQQIVNRAEADTDLIIFKCVHIYSNGAEIPSKDYDIEDMEKLKTAALVFEHLVHTQQFKMSACFLMIRRMMLTNHDIFFPVGLYSEDVYWSMHLWQYAHKVNFINLNFYGYHHREGSISATTTIKVYDSYDKIFCYWKEQCSKGCANSNVIMAYMSSMWVNRGYAFNKLPNSDKADALAILERHIDLLNYAHSQKTILARYLVKFFGVKKTAILLGWYWHWRTRYIGNAV
jgi:glycosyltransferase involved in cell wall biosynthesis